MGQPTPQDPRHDLGAIWVSEPVSHDVKEKRAMIHRQTEMYVCAHSAAEFNLLSELAIQQDSFNMLRKCISHSGSISKNGKKIQEENPQWV